MNPKFIGTVYAEGRVFLFEEYGDVYEFDLRRLEWKIIAYSPWPKK